MKEVLVATDELVHFTDDYCVTYCGKPIQKVGKISHFIADRGESKPIKHILCGKCFLSSEPNLHNFIELGGIK